MPVHRRAPKSSSPSSTTSRRETRLRTDSAARPPEGAGPKALAVSSRSQPARVLLSTARAANALGTVLDHLHCQIAVALRPGGERALQLRSRSCSQKTCPQSQRSGQCSTTSSTAQTGNRSRPRPSCPGCAPRPRPEESLPRFGAAARRVRARRGRGVARAAVQPPLELGDPLILARDTRFQPADLLIHPQQHRNHSLAALVVDRLRLGALHTPVFDAAGLCPPDQLNAYLKAASEQAVSHRGDDRNRTGVDGFAVRRKRRLLASVSGFRGPQVLSGALRSRSVWESPGRVVPLAARVPGRESVGLNRCPKGPGVMLGSPDGRAASYCILRAKQ